MFCRKVLVKVGEKIALNAYVFHVKWNSRCRDRVNSRGVVYKVGGKRCTRYLVGGEVTGKLMKYCRHYFEVRQLIRTFILYI